MQGDNGVEFEYDSCPMCKNGQVFDPSKGEFKTCTLCKGKGWVITDRMCSCGAPASMLSQDKILYCGRKECLADLRMDVTEAKYTTNWPPRIAGTAFPGYGEREGD